MIPMESIGYKPGAGDVIGRLKSLYERKAGDRVFADFQIPSLTMDQFRADHAEGYTSYPDPHERARFWDSLLKEKVLCEDDQIPSAYLSEFDQGLYGALIGGEIQFLNDPGTGWISSMVKPMIEDLTQFQLRPFEESHPWFSKYLHQLEVFSSVSENRFGLSHFILIDSPAGIEQGFRYAIAPADEILIVTNPEVAAVRDADRVIGLVEAEEKSPPQLIINRLRPDMVQRGEMLAVADVVELLAIDLVGIVPEDDAVLVTTNRGRPLTFSKDGSLAGRAFHNIARRLQGEDVPFQSLREPSLFERLFRFVRIG